MIQRGDRVQVEHRGETRETEVAWVIRREPGQVEVEVVLDGQPRRVKLEDE